MGLEDTPAPPDGYQFLTKPDPPGGFVKTISLILVVLVWYVVRSSQSLAGGRTVPLALVAASIGVVAIHTGIQSTVFWLAGYRPAVSLPHLSVISPDQFVERQTAVYAYLAPVLLLVVLLAVYFTIPSSVQRLAIGFGIGVDLGLVVMDLHAVYVLLRLPGGTLLYSRQEGAGPEMYIYGPTMPGGAPS